MGAKRAAVELAAAGRRRQSAATGKTKKPEVKLKLERDAKQAPSRPTSNQARPRLAWPALVLLLASRCCAATAAPDTSELGAANDQDNGASVAKWARQLQRSWQGALVVAEGRPLELACHALGLPLEFRPEPGAQFGGVWRPGAGSVTSASAGQQQQQLDDLVALVFWYKDSKPEPVYTLDARQASGNSSETSPGRRFGANVWGQNRRLLAGARHYVGDEPDFELAEPASEFPIIKLRLKQSKAHHSGNYKCRVDFRNSPTVSQELKLLVQAPVRGLDLSLVAGAATATATAATAPAVEQEQQHAEHLGARKIQLGEPDEAQFLCSARQPVSPPAKLDWLVRWPNGTSWLAAESESLGAGASRLRLRSVAQSRELHRSLLGCRLSQLQFAYSVEPAAKVGPDSSQIAGPGPGPGSGSGSGAPTEAGPSQLAELAAGLAPSASLRQVSRWFELSLTLGPEQVTLRRLDVGAGQQQPQLQRLADSASGGPVWLAELAELERPQFGCSSEGAWPAASLRWLWREPQTGLAVARQSGPVIELGEPVSWRQHHALELVCEATNDQLPIGRQDRKLVATLKLSVKFKPAVDLVESKAAANSGRRSLRCLVQSNPPINQLVWLVAGKPAFKLRPPTKQAANLAPSSTQTADFGQAKAQSQHQQLDDWLVVATNSNNNNNSGEPLDDDDEQELEARGSLLLVGQPKGRQQIAFAANQFKCLAKNELGEGQSGPLEPGPWLPRCSQLQQLRNPKTSSLEAKCGLDVTQPAQIFQFALIPMSRLAGLMQQRARLANNRPMLSQFQLADLAPLAGASGDSQAANSIVYQLNQTASARFQVSADQTGDELELDRLATNNSSEQSLALCRAANQFGWQQGACLSLSQQPAALAYEPAASGCSLEFRLAKQSSDIATTTTTNVHVDLPQDVQFVESVEPPKLGLVGQLDCSGLANWRELIFELQVSSASKTADATWLYLAGSLGWPQTVDLLAALTPRDQQDDKHARQYGFSADTKTDSDTETTTTTTTTNLGDARLAAATTLVDAIEHLLALASELRLALRWSNLIESSKTSEQILPDQLIRASQSLVALVAKLKTAANEQQPALAAGSGRGQPQLLAGKQQERHFRAPNAAQVSRFANLNLSAADLLPSLGFDDDTGQVLASSRPAKQQQQKDTLSRDASKPDSLLQRYELALYIGAMVGCLVTSALTLTLIVLLVRANIGPLIE